jgi:hypothetical protein
VTDFLAYVTANWLLSPVIIVGVIAANLFLIMSITIKRKALFVRNRYYIAVWSVAILSLLISVITFATVSLIRFHLFSKTAETVMNAPEESHPTMAPRPTQGLIITSPRNGSRVSGRGYIEGYVRDPKADVWVIVHPMELSSYWVQPQPTVSADGTWRVDAYFGRPGQDAGVVFEVLAIANPKVTLREAHLLTEWPKGDLVSDIIVVTRSR